MSQISDRQNARIPAGLKRELFRCAIGYALLFALVSTGRPQGCISSPNNPLTAICPANLSGTTNWEHRWISSADYRFYRSDRDFIGDVEQPQRQAMGTEVINTVSTWDVGATYLINERGSATLTLPFIYADRSSLYEHDFVHRHSMHSAGPGDLRLASDFWLLNPRQHMDGNISLGLGLSMPTGDDDAKDISYRASGPVLPVDPSIQPGDGGWGIVLELQAYQKIANHLDGYLQGSYVMTPQEQNGTELTIADIPKYAALLTPLRTHDSIPDQYFGRGGLSYVPVPAWGMALSFGGRIEGVPVYDAIGGSMGFRRPGYTISVEPGLSWTGKNNSVTLDVPVAVYRNRQRSAPEIALGAAGGDAFFADYSILLNYTHRF